jgi:hypothetical protein
MDPAYLSAMAALAGSTMGGMTSLAASWLGEYSQYRSQQRAAGLSRRETLYECFIEEASKLYADAYEHNQTDIAKIVNLYAMIGKMRVLSTTNVVENADRVVRVIVETYQGPNKTFLDIAEIVDDARNPLHGFSTACRDELQRDSI